MAEPARTSTIVEHTSPWNLAATLDRLLAVIEGAGMTLFARIDHAAAARAVGLAMPPTVVLVYGQARGGTPIMLATPLSALDLPLRVLVREDPVGRAVVALRPAVPWLADVGVPADLAMHLQPAQEVVLEALKP
jgi:uncharacterized protein (DUF302 family)